MERPLLEKSYIENHSSNVHKSGAKETFEFDLPPIDIALHSTVAKLAFIIVALSEFSARSNEHSSLCRGMEYKIDSRLLDFIWHTGFLPTFKGV